MMKNKMFLLLLLTILFSCYEQNLIVSSDNKSAELRLTVSLRSDFKSFYPNLDKGSVLYKYLNILDNKKLLEDELKNISNNFKLVNYSIEKDNFTSIYKISIFITNIENVYLLNSILPIEYLISFENNMTLTSIFTVKTFGNRQVILDSYKKEDPDSKNLTDFYLNTIKFKSIISTKETIVRSNRGKLSTDKKQVYLEAMLNDILLSDQRTDFDAEIKKL